MNFNSKIDKLIEVKVPTCNIEIIFQNSFPSHANFLNFLKLPQLLQFEI